MGRLPSPPPPGYATGSYHGMHTFFVRTILLHNEAHFCSKFKNNTSLSMKKWLKTRSRRLPASWLSGNAFISGAGDLRFESQTGQIGRSVANGSPPYLHFFERSCVARAFFLNEKEHCCILIKNLFKNFVYERWERYFKIGLYLCTKIFFWKLLSRM